MSAWRFAGAMASGALFGAGLVVSGMVDPGLVRAFLDVGGEWNPTLAFVLAGAVTVSALGYVVQRRMRQPLLGDRFEVPHNRTLDARLLGGAALFGVGWGLAGLCPGPAVVDLVLQPWPTLLFVAAMLAGMAAEAGIGRRAPAVGQPA